MDISQEEESQLLETSTSTHRCRTLVFNLAHQDQRQQDSASQLQAREEENEEDLGVEAV